MQMEWEKDIDGSATHTLALVRLWPKLQSIIRTTPKADADIRLDVPIGSESYIAQQLRTAKAVESVTLANGDCGGAEVSYFVAQRNSCYVNNIISPPKFQGYINHLLTKFLSGPHHNGSFRIENPSLVTSTVPPHNPTYTINIFADSFVTRRVAGFWDSFRADFTPADTPGNSINEVSIIVEVERLTSVPKAGRKQPPSQSWFDHRTENQDVDERTVANLIALSSVSTNVGYCVVQGEGYEQQKNVHPCDNIDFTSLDRDE
jgi:hypothetical protein